MGLCWNKKDNGKFAKVTDNTSHIPGNNNFEILQHICENCNLQQCTSQNYFIPITISVLNSTNTSTHYVPENKSDLLISSNADVSLNDSQPKKTIC